MFVGMAPKRAEWLNRVLGVYFQENWEAEGPPKIYPQEIDLS
jgi:hypothetical protein